MITEPVRLGAVGDTGELSGAGIVLIGSPGTAKIVSIASRSWLLEEQLSSDIPVVVSRIVSHPQISLVGVTTPVGVGIVGDAIVGLVSVSGIGLTSEEDRLSLHGEYRGTLREETELDSSVRTKKALAYILAYGVGRSGRRAAR